MFEILLFIFLFVIGSALGSFGSVVVDRMNRDESFIKGRSYCEKCKHVLSSKDLIPLFSYLSLGGKCRYCKKNIPIELFISEIFFGLSIAVVGSFFFFNFLYTEALVFVQVLKLIWFVILVFNLLLIFLSDLKYMLISDWQFIILGLVYAIGFGIYILFGGSGLSIFYADINSHFAGALLMVAFFGGIVFFSKERLMGQGDIYLAGLLGLFLGFYMSIVMWFLAFLSGALVGVLLISSRLKKFKSAVPFGPFLILGFFLALFFGTTLIEYYLLLLGF